MAFSLPSSLKGGLILALGVGLVAPVFATGCSGGNIDRPDQAQFQQGPNLAGPRDGVYLRAAFDDDPSMFIGRFIADGVEGDQIDENRAVQTQCSSFIKYREVRAAGTFDEYYNSSSSVDASLGMSTAVPTAPGGDASVSNQRGTTFRVQYELNRRLVAYIDDHEGFTQCCETAIGGCSGYYIGEFWAGTGTLYQNTGRSTDVGVQGSGGPEIAGVGYQADGNLEVADGWVWRRGMTFDDLYFAFRVMDVEVGGCAWIDRPPRSDDGHFFVGISPPAATQDMARTYAMRNARTQVVQYLGEAIATQSASRASLEGYLDDEVLVATAAEGIAARVKDDRYCPAETLETPTGVKYISRVLAFIPNEELDDAQREITEILAEETGDPDLQELTAE